MTAAVKGCPADAGALYDKAATLGAAIICLDFIKPMFDMKLKSNVIQGAYANRIRNGIL
jgi:hypothetical protein